MMTETVPEETTMPIVPELTIEPATISAPVSVEPETPVQVEVNPEPVKAPVIAFEVQPEVTVIAEVVSTPIVEETQRPLEPVETKAVQPVVAVEPPVVVIATPLVDIEKAIEESGLVMVETSSDKVKSWQPEFTAIEAEPRPRRKRPVPVTLPDEPLVMVETSRKD
jgi:ribonuclease E